MTALDHFIPRQRVRVRWTSSNRQYDGTATLTRVNAKTIRADVDAEVTVSGLEYVDGQMREFTEPSTGWEGRNLIFPWPGTPFNRVDAIEEITEEQIEEAKDAERDRLTRKAERFAGFADNAARSAAEAFDKAHAAIADIPPGQPILVDHYSAPRHRRLLARHESGMRKGFAEDERAATWDNRVAGINREMRRKGLL